MKILPKPEREYIFSFIDKEFPVYGKNKTRVGNCKKVNVCDVEKREIHAYKDPSKKIRKVESFIKDRLSNGLFLQITPSEECIALRPLNINSGSISKESRYYLIPNMDYRYVSEFDFLKIGGSIYNEAIVLNFDVNKIEDLSKYHSFDMKGDKNKLLW